ncbi:unnamed protein product [Protopolystoma xenopodis]|uniref:URB1 N-terminal domain-containing protein n=1 Tax=Protopolystoma xenopodis TaxID=117903 RepID=A0A448WH70_9PLAT|nr:unnamed protein product [Protopolystoma xenopodis]
MILVLIFRLLSILIVRTSTDLAEEHAPIARTLTEALLAPERLRILTHILLTKSVEAVKSALSLLACIPTVSIEAAHDLLRSLDFGVQSFSLCSRNRNLKDDNDVRTCFVNLISAFFFTNSNQIIRDLVNKKDALALLLNGIFTDKYQNLMLILQLLTQKIIYNC